MYQVFCATKVKKEIKLLQQNNLEVQFNDLLEHLKSNPTAYPTKTLTANLRGFYSLRINHTHRLVFQVDETEKKVKIVSCWSHY